MKKTKKEKGRRGGERERDKKKGIKFVDVMKIIKFN